MESFFPNIQQKGVDYSWLTSKAPKVTLIKPSNFDADPTFRDFQGLETFHTELAFFREGYKIKERDMEELVTILDSSSQRGLQAVLNRIYSEVYDLILSARATREALRWTLVLNGAIKLKHNGVALGYDYHFSAEQTVKPTVSWKTSATATPLDDLLTWKDEAETRTGKTISYVIMNSVTFNNIVKATSTNKLFKDFVLGVPRKQNVLNYLSDNNVSILLYDKKYVGYDKKEVKYCPDGKIVFLPDEDLGNTVFGTTPEELQQMFNTTPVPVSIIDTGVAITRSVVTDVPVSIRIYVSQLVIPVLVMGDNVTVASVYETQE